MPFQLGPYNSLMVNRFLMAKIASVVGVTALEFNGYYVQFTMIMRTPGLTVDGSHNFVQNVVPPKFQGWLEASPNTLRSDYNMLKSGIAREDNA
ncbi:hypothetical protein [Paenibacillus radicis (ex Xue et al. 2023)]|uniref:Uncharacterized protein n=1 Tax=Paenibacillus radicis (ex Xue et al. 2023) TaxID=2972489 RepID=A0ABT1YHG2_9BACL|nr:hypothetical protein [Paenibacillus radicis (ex Xue et al. 2023)]MCR8632631.1 hypothetical protein [Paenibacillus radicis (ex Xue et al. 2023)]